MTSDTTVGEMFRRCLKQLGFVPPVKQVFGSSSYTISCYWLGKSYEKKSNSLEELLMNFYNWAIAHKEDTIHQQLAELKAMADQEELVEKVQNMNPVFNHERAMS